MPTALLRLRLPRPSDPCRLVVEQLTDVPRADPATGRFEGRLAFVTGATTAPAGARTAVAETAADGATETAGLIEPDGGQSLALAQFGRVDIAFNNAFAEQPRNPVTDVTDDGFDRLVAINLRGVSRP